MGIQDNEKLAQIKKWTLEFNDTFKTNFRFIVDYDTKKTKRVFISEDGKYKVYDFLTKQQAEKLRSQGFDMFVPDLADYQHNLIIEYQEEPKPNRGYMNARITKKGHTSESKHDTNKNTRYHKAGFKVLELWESGTEHDNKLRLFSWLYDNIKQT